MGDPKDTVDCDDNRTDMEGYSISLGDFCPCVKKTLRNHCPEGIRAISLHNIKLCKVGRLEDPENTGNNLFHQLRKYLLPREKTHPPPTFYKNPSLLQELQFCHRISSFYFQTLTSHIFNLKLLSLHWDAMSSVNASVLEPLYFPNLTILNIIGGPDFSSKSNASDYSGTFIENLKHFSKNVFISLRMLNMEIPSDSRFPISMHILFDCTLDFLANHATTLLICKLELVFLESYSGSFRNSYNQTIFKSPSSLLQKVHRVSQQLNLKSFQLLANQAKVGRVSFPNQNLWISLIYQLKSLKEFWISGLNVNLSSLKMVVRSNFIALSCLTLCINCEETGSWIPFNCNVLSSCASLRYLSVEGWKPSKVDDPLGISYTTSLPRLLKTLCIKYLHVCTSSLEKLCIGDESAAEVEGVMMCPQLEHLRLIEIGNDFGFGMTASILNFIFKQKRIRTLAVTCDSICCEERKGKRRVPVPAIFHKINSRGDEHPVNFLRNHKDEIIEVRLKANGSYEVLNVLNL